MTSKAHGLFRLIPGQRYVLVIREASGKRTAIESDSFHESPMRLASRSNGIQAACEVFGHSVEVEYLSREEALSLGLVGEVK